MRGYTCRNVSAKEAKVATPVLYIISPVSRSSVFRMHHDFHAI